MGLRWTRNKPETDFVNVFELANISFQAHENIQRTFFQSQSLTCTVHFLHADIQKCLVLHSCIKSTKYDLYHLLINITAPTFVITRNLPGRVLKCWIFSFSTGHTDISMVSSISRLVSQMRSVRSISRKTVSVGWKVNSDVRSLYLIRHFKNVSLIRAYNLKTICFSATLLDLQNTV